jgi:hypothetical protein
MVCYGSETFGEEWDCEPPVWQQNLLSQLIASNLQKPLTIHFFEQANEARGYRKESLLSPSFFDIEGNAAKDVGSAGGMDVVQAYLDHALGNCSRSNCFHSADLNQVDSSTRAVTLARLWQCSRACCVHRLQPHPFPQNLQLKVQTWLIPTLARCI